MNNIDFTNFISSMLASITTQQVLTILASVVGVGMIFFLMWLGVRLMISRFTKAVEGGKISSISYTTDYYMEKPPTPKVNEGMSDYQKEMWEKYYHGQKTIGESDLAPEPIEPIPRNTPITKEEIKEMEDWDNTHYRNGGEIGFDLREYWYFTDKPKYNKWKKESNQYKKKKYNNNSKNYYYDSYGNKYYK